MSFKQQFIALLALAANSEQAGREICAQVQIDEALREEYKLIKAKKSKLSRARRNRVIHIVELNGGLT